QPRAIRPHQQVDVIQLGDCTLMRRDRDHNGGGHKLHTSLDARPACEITDPSASIKLPRSAAGPGSPSFSLTAPSLWRPQTPAPPQGSPARPYPDSGPH